MPVVEPARIGPALLAVLVRRKPLWIAIHSNHPRELTEAAKAACGRLVRTGATLLGQTVLLRGVNDDAAILEALFRAMVAERIKPYYLHHPDLAPGTAGFRLSIDEGRAIVGALRGGCRDWPSRPMCSTYPAAPEKCRSAPIWWRPAASAIPPAGCTPTTKIEQARQTH